MKIEFHYISMFILFILLTINGIVQIKACKCPSEAKYTTEVYEENKGSIHVCSKSGTQGMDDGGCEIAGIYTCSGPDNPATEVEACECKFIAKKINQLDRSSVACINEATRAAIKSWPSVMPSSGTVPVRQKGRISNKAAEANTTPLPVQKVNVKDSHAKAHTHPITTHRPSLTADLGLTTESTIDINLDTETIPEPTSEVPISEPTSEVPISEPTSEVPIPEPTTEIPSPKVETDLNKEDSPSVDATCKCPPAKKYDTKMYKEHEGTLNICSKSGAQGMQGNCSAAIYSCSGPNQPATILERCDCKLIAKKTNKLDQSSVACIDAARKVTKSFPSANVRCDQCGRNIRKHS